MIRFALGVSVGLILPGTTHTLSFLVALGRELLRDWREAR